jgi:hypothetical protein
MPKRTHSHFVVVRVVVVKFYFVAVAGEISK